MPTVVDPIVRALIVRTAQKHGIDPAAALAVAAGEGGIRYGAVGDAGTSYGPFQLHVGGALPKGRGADWANSPAGIEYAIRTMAQAGARGLRGPAAVDAIVRKFERPADPDTSVRNAQGRLSQFSAYTGGRTTPAVAAQPQRAAAAPPLNTAGSTAVSPILQSVYNANNELLGVPSIDLGAVTAATSQRRATQPKDLPVPVVREFRGKQPKVVNKVLSLAREYLGTPYSWGGGGPAGPSTGTGRGAGTVGFDCSSFIQFLYARQGIEIPRVTYDQAKAGRPVDIKALQAGDAVFFRPGPRGPEHVGLYLGQGKFMHAPKTGDVIKISRLTDSYYRQNFVVGRRYV